MKHKTSILTAVALFVFFSSLTFGQATKTTIVWKVDKSGKKLRKEMEKQVNDKGDIIKQVEYSGGYVICEMYSYQYKNGRKENSIRSNCNRSSNCTKTLYIYDKLGRLIQEITYDAKNHLDSRQVNIYNDNNKNAASREVYNGTEKASHDITTLTYYPNNLLKKEYQEASGSWFGTDEYKYDEHGNMIYHEASVDGGVGIVKYYFTYKNNILVSDVVKTPGSSTEYHSYEYRHDQVVY